MKKTVLILLLLVSGLFAQRKTFFEGQIDNGGFGAPRIKVSSVRGNLGVLVGAYGGWLIDHKLLIGGGGYGLANNIKAQDDVQSVMNYKEQPYVDFGYGGGVLEYYFNPDELIHSSVSVLIGAGGVSYRSSDFDHNSSLGGWNDTHKGDVVFVLEPGIGGEINVAKYFKVGASLSYRYVSGVDLYGMKNSDLSNFSAGIALKFGVF